VPLRRLKRAIELDAFPDPPLVRTRFPVVLIHGFGSLGTIGKPGLLHQQARFLRTRGVLAFAPNVSPYDTVPVRCAQWQQHIDRVIEETGAEKINLIGYSAGGLDARYIVSSCGYEDRIASVITINAPNRGSHLAAWTLESRGPLPWIAMTSMELAGRLSFTTFDPRVEAGVREMTPEYVCEVFNPQNPDIEGVYYASWAGLAGKGTDTRITPFLVVQNRILYGLAGPNDGMVPLESAQWGDFRGTVPSDHLRMAGVVPGSRKISNELFLTVARHLAEKGF